MPLCCCVELRTREILRDGSDPSSSTGILVLDTVRHERIQLESSLASSSTISNDGYTSDMEAPLDPGSISLDMDGLGDSLSNQVWQEHDVPIVVSSLDGSGKKPLS